MELEELSETTTKAHRKTVEATPADMAAFLADALGVKLLAYMVGVDPKTVGRWVSGDTEPKAEKSVTRLRAGAYIVRHLTPVESSYTIRAWFAGMNPLLNDTSPATAIRDGREQEVVAAARAFASDG